MTDLSATVYIVIVIVALAKELLVEAWANLILSAADGFMRLRRAFSWLLTMSESQISLSEKPIVVGKQGDFSRDSEMTSRSMTS